MSTKLKEFTLLILLLLNISITGFIGFSRNDFEARANPETRIYVDPASGTANVGETYTISVKVEDIINFRAFDIKLRWGAAVLRYISHTVTVPVETYPEGVLYDPSLLLKDEVNETQVPDTDTGTMGWFAYISLGDTFNGSGTILTMDFEVLGEGECDIYFVATDLSDDEANPIIHQVEEGYFYMPGLGNVPIANFTFSPDPVVATKTVTFNASASYDPDGNVALYMWNFADGNITNTPNAIITHSYTKTGFYDAQLTVLDDQGDGSQSRLCYARVEVVLPNPVAEFTFWPDIAVVNKTATFDASASYDPDPDGRIVQYCWDFGPKTLTNITDRVTKNTTEPITTHNFTYVPEVPTLTVNLTVVDLEGLPSTPYWTEVPIVERRDIELTDVTVSPSELTRGDNVTIKATVANYGLADENFNVTAYYNRTVSEWIEIEQVTGENLSKQYIPKWRFTSSNSSANPVNWAMNEGTGGLVCSNDTKVKVANRTGYWTINPGRLNEEDASASIVDSPICLATGGWIWEEEAGGSKIINGDFHGGNWSLLVRLYATEHNVNATILVRILKSDNADPQAISANVTVIKDWTELFTASLSNTTKHYQGNITIPQTTLTDEHLYLEYQLHVTGNLASNDTEVIFQIGVPYKFTGPHAQAEATMFSYKEQYTFIFNTEDVAPGYHTFMVNASEIPHAHNYTNITNNVKYTDNINVKSIAPNAKFTFIPVTPSINERILFDASETIIDPFLNATYSWDFGDDTFIANITDPTVTHIYAAEGNYTVTLTVIDSLNQTDSIARSVMIKLEYIPLDLTVDVGKVHFRGETAEFYILVSRAGQRFNASEVNANLYFNGSVIESFLMENITHITTGLYMIRYNIPITTIYAPSGTYTLVVDANYLSAGASLNLLGTNLATFLLSSTLTGWDALLTEIDNEIATIIIPGIREIKANLALINATLVDIKGTLGIVNSALGTFTVKLNDVNATLSSLITDGKGEMLAEINTALGPVTVRLDNLNTTITNIKGTTATIETDLEEIQVSIGGVHSVVTLGLAVASALSAAAAAAAVLAVLLLKKLHK
jgi:PKD repeat protein